MPLGEDFRGIVQRLRRIPSMVRVLSSYSTPNPPDRSDKQEGGDHGLTLLLSGFLRHLIIFA